jgi:glycosyltransferase involved in cell wall biosynthesis/FMN phosphatase YigB (HAD superfamily)
MNNKQDPLSIVFVLSRFVTHSLHGVEIYTYGLARELIRRGHKIHVVVPTYNLNQPPGKWTEENIEGITLIQINLHRSSDPYDLGFINGQTSQAFRELLPQLKANIIHFQEIIGFSATPLETCFKLGIPVIFTAHDAAFVCEQLFFIRADNTYCINGPESFEKCAGCFAERHHLKTDSGAFTRLQNNFSQRQAYISLTQNWIDTLITPSLYLQRIFHRYGYNHKHIKVIPQGLQPQSILPWDGPKEIVRFVFIGNAYPVKGIDILFKAFNYIDPTKARLNLYGNIPDQTYFQQCAQIVNPGWPVIHYGAYTPKELPLILSQADIAIVPSRSENYPLTIRECLQAGVPVIASNIGGIPEIIQDGVNGVLFNSDDFEDLARKLKIFTDKPSQIHAFRDRIKPVRSISEEVDDIENIYREVINRKDAAVHLNLLNRNTVEKLKSLRSLVTPTESNQEMDKPQTPLNLPIISVILPAFHAEKLSETIQSVLNQTLENFELIIISPKDNQIEKIIQTFKDTRIRHHPFATEKEPGHAFNAGVRLVRAPLIAYITIAALYYNNHLQTLVEHLIQNNKEIVYTDGINSINNNSQKRIEYSTSFSREKILLEPLCRIESIAHHRKCLMKTGLFDETMPDFAEWELLARLSQYYPLQHIKKVTFEYESNDNKISQGKWIGNLFHAVQVIHLRNPNKIDQSFTTRLANHRLTLGNQAILAIHNQFNVSDWVTHISLTLVYQILGCAIQLENRQDIELVYNLILAFLNHMPNNDFLWLLRATSQRFLGMLEDARRSIIMSLAAGETPEKLSEFIHILDALGKQNDANNLRQYFHSLFPQVEILTPYPVIQESLNIEFPEKWQMEDNSVFTKYYNPDIKMLTQIQTETAYWTTDRDLVSAYFEIRRNSNRFQIVSFDCFDTIIGRLLQEPTNLFLEVGRRLQQAKLFLHSISPAEYRDIRRTAESLARQILMGKAGTSEVTLEEIYQQLTHVVIDPVKAADVELQTEKDLCFLNPAIVSLIERLQLDGFRILVLSDVYLSSIQVEDILKANGFNCDILDAIITSSEKRCSKGDGRIFSVVQNLFNLQPHEFFHLGDNEFADYRQANIAGWRGFHYCMEEDSQIGVILNRERMAWYGEKQTASLDTLRKLVRKNTRNLNNEDKLYFQHGAFTLGPVLSRYADWSIDQFRQEGVTRVLSLMREGQLFTPLLRRAAKASELYLEVRDTYVSRVSTNLAALGEVTPMSIMERHNQKLQRNSLRKVLFNFGLDPDKDTSLSTNDLEQDINHESLSVLVDILMQPAIKKLVEEHSSEKRKEVLAYILPLIDDKKIVGIADLGYRGTIQENLQRIFWLEKIPVKLIGAYFATHTTSAALKIVQGFDIRAYFPLLETRDMAFPFVHNPFLFENAISAGNIGTTIGYAIEGESAHPVLGTVMVQPGEENRREMIRQGVLAFQDAWLNILAHKYKGTGISSPLSDKLIAEIDKQCAVILNRICTAPTYNEALQFGNLTHEDVDEAHTICDDQTRAVFRQGGIQGLKMLNPRPYWPQGIIALEQPSVMNDFYNIWYTMNNL